MGASQNLVTLVGLILIVALLLLLCCRYLGGWRRTRAWIHSSREEKANLTRSGLKGLWNPTNSMVGSESEVNISSGGSFRRFDKTDSEYELGEKGGPVSGQVGARQIPTSAPPTNFQRSVGSTLFAVDNFPTPPKIPPPPPVITSTTKGPTSISSTNPFIPLFQASTQFFTHTISNFGGDMTSSSSQAAVNLPSNHKPPNISMGELLFSSSSTEQTGPVERQGPIKSELDFDLLEHRDVEPLGLARQEKTLLETMREEIRLESERIQDVTKNLLGDCEEEPKVTRDQQLPISTDRKFSAPEIGTENVDNSNCQIVLPGQPLAGSSRSNEVTAIGGSAYRNRSFSLRQVSVDSIGDTFDLTSPETFPPFLQRAMSCDSVCSDTSVVLGDFDVPHITGYLCIGLEYDSDTADLIVNVMEGKELCGLDPDPTAPFDSYVRVYLLPDKTTNMQTRIYRKSLSPVYKEQFMFGLDVSEIPSRALVFYLYATNKFANTLLGEAELRLAEFDIGKPVISWLPLTDTGQRGGELGEIMFSLSYLPTAERLTVVVVKARNLKFPHQKESGDPFVKVYLLQKGKKVSKKKSSTKKAERNPIFNEAMIFSVPTHALQTIQLRITVSDTSESEGRAYSIGHVIVGSSASGKALSHWNQMLSSLRKPIGMFHSLRK